MLCAKARLVNCWGISVFGYCYTLIINHVYVYQSNSHHSVTSMKIKLPIILNVVCLSTNTEQCTLTMGSEIAF